MAKLKILIAPHPSLKKVSQKVNKVDKQVQKTLKDMLELMYEANGIGLAANQVGIDKRLVVVDVSYDKRNNVPKEPMYFINPEIIEISKEISVFNEGCLSLPNEFDEVERPATCTVKALDFNGKEFTLKCEGLLATCIQHEIDHLNGIIFADHLSRLKRNRMIARLTKSKKNKEYSAEIFQY